MQLVIEGRYGHGAIILTTNRAFTEWPELFDNQALDAEETARRERVRLRQIEEATRRERDAKESASAAAKRDNARALLAAAERLAKEGRFAEARDNALKASEDLSNDAKVWAMAGYCSLMLNEPEVGVLHLSRTIELDPSDWRSIVNRAHAYDRLWKRQESLKDLERALELMPTDTEERAAVEDAAKRVKAALQGDDQ